MLEDAIPLTPVLLLLQITRYTAWQQKQTDIRNLSVTFLHGSALAGI